MKMVFRWFGEGNDTVSLKFIKQIPGVEGVAWALHDLPAGEEWPLNQIKAVKEQVEAYGLHIEVVESVNIHEDIKLGLPTREKYIDNYARTIENLGKAGVKVICYNFMPVFDWTRTNLYGELEDKSTALYFESNKIDDIDPMELVKQISYNSDFTMPGWEPERLKLLAELFDIYKEITEEDLWANLQYFLEKIIPVAAQYEIKMALHPDDPPWPVFGLPRIMTNQESFRRCLNLIDHPSNGITLCSGSLGAEENNNIPEMIRDFSDRIHFAHIRNVKRLGGGSFIETSHRSADGSVDMYEVMKAYHDINFNGYVRPDHGRHIWDEKCRPGYGLYDRALGVMYLWGIWDTLVRSEKEATKDVANK